MKQISIGIDDWEYLQLLALMHGMNVADLVGVLVNRFKEGLDHKDKEVVTGMKIRMAARRNPASAIESKTA